MLTSIHSRGTQVSKKFSHRFSSFHYTVNCEQQKLFLGFSSAKLPSTHKTPVLCCETYTGCYLRMWLLTSISHSFLCTPSTGFPLCNEEATPVNTASTTTPPHHHRQMKPLRLSSSKLPIKVLFPNEIWSAGCTINWGSNAQNIVRNQSDSACSRRIDKEDTVRMQQGRRLGKQLGDSRIADNY